MLYRKAEEGCRYQWATFGARVQLSRLVGVGRLAGMGHEHLVKYMHRLDLSCGNCSFTVEQTNSSANPTPVANARSLLACHPRNYDRESTIVSCTRGGTPKFIQLTKSRRRVSVVKLPAQHLEKKVESRRP